MNHNCHAKNCDTPVPPAMFMCRPHWYMVPALMRKTIWSTYRPGQEIDKTPSAAYLKVARAAIEAVAEKEAAA